MGVVFVAVLACLAVTFGSSGFLPLAPFIVYKAAVGWCLTVNGLAQVATILYIGPLSNRVGNHVLLQRSLLLHAVCLAFTVGSAALACQLFGRLLQGIAGTACFIASMALVVENFQEPERAQHIGTVLGACMVGALLGAPMTSWAYAIADQAPFRTAWAFFPSMILLFVAAIAMSRLKLAAPMASQEKLLEASAGGDQGRSPFGVYQAVGRQAGLIVAMITVTCAAMMGLQCAGVLELQHLGMTPATIGAALIPNSLAQALISTLAGRLSSTPARRRRVLLSSLLFLVVSLALVACMPWVGMAAVVTALVASSVAMALVDAPSISLMTELATSEGCSSGEAVTASELFFTLGCALGPCLGSFGRDVLGFQGLCLAIAATAGVLVVLCFAALTEGAGHRSTSSANPTEDV